MSTTLYNTRAADVKERSSAIIPPQPGEFVANLLAAGHIEDAVAVQLHQYREGVYRALYGRPVTNAFPAAMQRGYRDALADKVAEPEVER